MQTAEYSIWLLPSAAQAESLNGTIAHLSAALGGARFAPHVTLQGDLSLPVDRLAGALAALAAETPVQTWRVQQVERSAHFFRCLYLRFGREQAFEHLRGCVQAITSTVQGLSPYAHLSLAYGHPQPESIPLCAELGKAFAGQAIALDRLAISLSSKGLPIADWQCVAEYALAQP